MNVKQIELALEFVSKGVRIFPQVKNGDRPGGSPAGVKWKEDASDDPVEIRAWSERYEKCNFAAATGSDSGIIVLDVDVKNERPGKESLRRLIDEFELPETHTVRSPSGGHHLHFLYPVDSGKEIRNMAELPGYPGIEVKGDGGCITLPGSFFSSGAEYRLESDLPFARLPDAFVQYLNESRNVRPVAEFPLGQEIPEGQRHNAMLELIGSLHGKGVETSLIEITANAANSDQCDPPLPNKEVQQMVEDITAKPRNQDSAGSNSLATMIVDLVMDSGIQFVHDGDDVFARIRKDEHVETYAIKSNTFSMLVSSMVYQANGTVVTTQSLSSALNTMAGQAQFEGESVSVHVRLAAIDETIFLDLGDDSWQVVRIDSTGWAVENPPDSLCFIRPNGLEALPLPVTGDYRELQAFINVPDESNFKLVTGWLIGALNPAGPFPIMILNGEQGSAKSTTARIIRSVIDPNGSPLRAMSRDERDLFIQAANSHILCFDNLSGMSDTMSDACCRIATGGGYATRTLYANDQETIFDEKRPIILNGIDEITDRGDLLDRAIVIDLPRISGQRRVLESSLMDQFCDKHGQILGGILDAVVGSIRQRALPDYRSPDSLP